MGWEFLLRSSPSVDLEPRDLAKESVGTKDKSREDADGIGLGTDSSISSLTKLLWQRSCPQLSKSPIQLSERTL